MNDNKKPLALKYRPLYLSKVIGQNRVIGNLTKSLQQNRLHNAYLFCGKRGTGKTTIARAFAKSINCAAYKEPVIHPCLTCSTCKAIADGDDIDVLEIDGATNNGVEQVRELRMNANIMPAFGKSKIYLIDEVHMLSIAAFNALLKILEEPPSHVKFIFATTEKRKIPATILSRCQCHDLSSISIPQLAEHLKNIMQLEQVEWDEEFVFPLAKLSDGSLRDALTLLEQLIISAAGKRLTLELLEHCLGVPKVEAVQSIILDGVKRDFEKVVQGITSLVEAGTTELGIIDVVIDCMRDLMVLSAADESLVSLTPRQLKKAKEIVKAAGEVNTLHFAMGVEKFEGIRNNPKRHLIESGLVRLFS